MNASAVVSPGVLIVGCWQFDHRSWQVLPPNQIRHALDTYLALGINAFDTADIYGQSEKFLGDFLAKRDCVVLTKAVFFGEPPTPMQIRHKVENSLRSLRREALDGLFVHWHHPDTDFSACFETLQTLVEEGKIGSLGVTNFNTPMLEKALKLATIQAHQVQYSLIDRRVEATMQPLCQAHGIRLVTYGALAGGFLSHKFLQTLSLKGELDHARGFFYNRMIEMHGGWSPVQALLQVLRKIADEHQKTIAQVALNWVKQQAGVQGVICGFTGDRQQIQQNAELGSWNLSPEAVQTLTVVSNQCFQQPGDIYSYERLVA